MYILIKNKRMLLFLSGKQKRSVNFCFLNKKELNQNVIPIQTLLFLRRRPDRSSRPEGRQKECLLHLHRKQNHRLYKHIVPILSPFFNCYCHNFLCARRLN